MQEEKTLPEGAESDTTDAGTRRDDVSQKKEMRSRRGAVIRIVVLATVVMVLSAGISALVARTLQPAYVVFDMKGTLDTFRQQTAQTPLTKEAIATLTARFGTALNTSLTGWQAAHGGIILVKGAVVGGAADITPEIQADIARQMQGAP